MVAHLNCAAAHFYPGEGHGLMTYKNRRAKMAWDLAWLDRYLLGKRK